MYIPSSFLESDPSVLADFIAREPLGLLFSAGGSGLMTSPVPFRLRPNATKPTLVAHLARANPQWKDLTELSECLVVFLGADNYVAPSWYATKAKTQKVVPTWNYELVEVKGIPSVIHSADWLLQQVEELTHSEEHKRPHPWKVSDAPPDYVASQLKAIVGVEIEITSFRGKWKMSQNKTAEDAQGVAAGLTNPDDPHANAQVAALVTSRNPPK